MSYHIKADTPEEVRAEIVKWLNYNAGVNRNRARNIRGKIKSEKAFAVAETYELAAKFINDIYIQTKG